MSARRAGPARMAALLAACASSFVVVTVVSAPGPASGAGPATCQGVAATIVGTPGKDVIVGTPGRDVVQAGAGRDRVTTVGGRDLVCGGRGQDHLDAGAGRDIVRGGGDSRFDQGDGAYFVGDDLTGGAGDDLVLGGDGRGEDSLRFDEAPQRVTVDLGEGAARGHGRDRFGGIETVWGSPYGDRMTGRYTDLLADVRDDLAFWGQGGADVLRSDGEMQGGPGPDTVVSAGGYADAGGGRDELTYAPWAQDPPRRRTAVFVAGPGDDLIRTAGTTRSVSDPGRGDDVVVGGSGRDSVTLSPGNDTITTGDGDDHVASGFGHDEVSTGAGDDTVSLYCDDTRLDAGAGDDVVDSHGFAGRHCAEPGDDDLIGGAGRDRLSYAGLRLHRTTDGVVVDLGAGTVTGAAGTDTVHGFEDVTGSGGTDELTGDAAPNVLDGRSGRDVLAGGDGDDELLGDEGADDLRGDDGTDSADGGAGTDACEAETESSCEA